MNWDQIKGNWLQVKGKIKEEWGDLTDDDVTEIDGQEDQLIGKLQARYGYTKERAQQEVSSWSARI